ASSCRHGFDGKRSQHIQSFASVRIIRPQLERGLELTLPVLDVALAAVYQPEVAVEVGAEPAIAANLEGLVQVFDRLGPVARVRRLKTEIAELLDAVRKLALLFERVEAGRVFLGLRLSGFGEGLRQTVKGLGAFGVRLDGEAEVLDGFVRIAEPQQVLAEQGLRVGIVRGELDETLEQLRGLLSVAELLGDMGQKIERGRVVRLQPRRRRELGAGLLPPVQVVERASLVVVRDGRIRIKPYSLRELFKS